MPYPMSVCHELYHDLRIHHARFTLLAQTDVIFRSQTDNLLKNIHTSFSLFSLYRTPSSNSSLFDSANCR